jgi:hypothetical protein
VWPSWQLNKITHKKRVRRTPSASIPEFAQEPCVFRHGSVRYGEGEGSHMGVYRNRSGSVGRPFTKGNPGGGRPKGRRTRPPGRSRSSPVTFLCRTDTGGVSGLSVPGSPGLGLRNPGLRPSCLGANSAVL